MIWKLLGALSGATLVGVWWLLVLEHPALQPLEAAAAGGVTPMEEKVGPQLEGRDPKGPIVPLAASRQPPAPEPTLDVPLEPDGPAPAPEPAAQTEPAPSRRALEEPSPPAVARLDAESAPLAAIAAGAKAEPLWHPLWSPFRSQASAQGFADHLSRLSGRHLRVEHRGPGRYRVQLAYRDAADLQLGLDRIAEVSGLSPEAPP